jgi:ParB family chromosome partitioning protein
MSLVENLARRKPSTTDLLREVRRLKGQRYSPTNIARVLGMDRSYIADIISLLKRGEDELIARVEAGRLPIEAAVAIAAGTDTEVQRALSEAYEKGTLRGARLRTVQQLITKRRAAKSPRPGNTALTSADLVRTYEHHTHQQRALVRRASVITQRLAILTSSLRRLLVDEHFVTLLRAEGLRTMPEYIARAATRS